MIPIPFTTSGSQRKSNSSRNGSFMLRLNGSQGLVDYLSLDRVVMSKEKLVER